MVAPAMVDPPADLKGLTTWEKISKSPFKVEVLYSLGWTEQEVMHYVHTVTLEMPKSFEEAAITLTREKVPPTFSQAAAAQQLAAQQSINQPQPQGHPENPMAQPSVCSQTGSQDQQVRPHQPQPQLEQQQPRVHQVQFGQQQGPAISQMTLHPQATQSVLPAMPSHHVGKRGHRRPAVNTGTASNPPLPNSTAARDVASANTVTARPGTRMHVCATCGLQFNRNSNLKVHQVVHTRERPHACELCWKRFGLKGALTAHLKTHSEERPHECKICGKKFRADGNLQKHRRTHTRGLSMEVKIASAESAVDELPVEKAQNLIAGLQKRLRSRSLGRRKKAEYPLMTHPQLDEQQVPGEDNTVTTVTTGVDRVELPAQSPQMAQHDLQHQLPLRQQLAQHNDHVYHDDPVPANATGQNNGEAIPFQINLQMPVASDVAEERGLYR